MNKLFSSPVKMRPAILNNLQLIYMYPYCVFLFSLFFYLSFCHLGINLWDEGLLLNGAQRVMHGDIPIRDFLAYPPGRYYLLAFFYKLFGVSIITARVMEAVLAAVMETPLFIFLIGICLYLFEKRNYFLIGITCALLIITRGEAVVNKLYAGNTTCKNHLKDTLNLVTKKIPQPVFIVPLDRGYLSAELLDYIASKNLSVVMGARYN